MAYPSAIRVSKISVIKSVLHLLCLLPYEPMSILDCSLVISVQSHVHEMQHLGREGLDLFGCFVSKYYSLLLYSYIKYTLLRSR